MWATHRNRPTFTPMDNSVSYNPKCNSLNCERKLECLKIPYADTGRTCKLHTHSNCGQQNTHIWLTGYLWRQIYWWFLWQTWTVSWRSECSHVGPSALPRDRPSSPLEEEKKQKWYMNVENTDAVLSWGNCFSMSCSCSYIFVFCVIAFCWCWFWW